MIAAERGDNVILNKLLDCSKLDVNAKDKDGNTAYDLARIKGKTSVCSRLTQLNGIVIGDHGESFSEEKAEDIIRPESKETKALTNAQRNIYDVERSREMSERSTSSSQPRLPTITPQYGNSSNNNNNNNNNNRSRSEPNTGGYSIINQHQNADAEKVDETVIALRTILEQEQKKLKKVFNFYKSSFTSYVMLY